jgi:hypothetical protein
MLAFFGIEPGMKVAHLWASGGYTTELLARAVAPSGMVYSQNGEMPAGDAWKGRLKEPGMGGAIVELLKPFTNPGDILPVPAGSHLTNPIALYQAAAEHTPFRDRRSDGGSGRATGIDLDTEINTEIERREERSNWLLPSASPGSGCPPGSRRQLPCYDGLVAAAGHPHLSWDWFGMAEVVRSRIFS